MPIAEAQGGDFVVSHPGTLSAAIVSPIPGGEPFEPFTIVSLCAEYDRPHRSTGKMSWKITDASVHRVISDLSLFIGRQKGHRVIAAGDLSIYHGYSDEDKSGYWEGRYDTVFARMAALGMPLVGPQDIDGEQGRQPDPWPDLMPKDSKNVATYRNAEGTERQTERQLDFVFASESMVNSVEVRALNGLDEWGPSDHCRIEILVEP